ncbi:Ingression protein fic1 [Madurella fahalii]|uniref:Ingression protein fic1 n=1 Tax=Madurella fahalii TaxID=1157608 RepID=A0ABQ0GBT5_9PEZI
MTTKSKTHPLNGMHTSGIFSDMSVDGPEVGTLVVVVDRAKNLPNRKTIGKQDPYCAARLGKEAKKTTTDIRGGQTPKWDQELRFTVHDSPDYYQLKVSVFNDDKKTELIGEAWIDLRDIIVPGGGQSDQWHQLGCRGKYAGEVRIEITYYDSRPKPEKPVVKAKPTPTAAEADAKLAAAGPRTMPKRRPLPSDPVTGKASATPSPAPEQAEAPARPQPNPAPTPTTSQSSLQQAEYSPAPAAGSPAYYQQQPDHYPRRQPSEEFGASSRRVDALPQQYRTPEKAEKYPVQPDDQGYSQHYQQPAYDHYDPKPHDHHGFPQADDTMGLEDDRPPPPPAHRSRAGSNSVVNAALQNGFELTAKGTPPTMRQDVLRSEAHRHSTSGSYPGRPTYKGFDSAPAGLIGYYNADQPSPPRHHSYDSSYDMQSRTMQATVEDVPESPESMNNAMRRSMGRLPSSQTQPQFDPDYDMAASPAPLNLGGKGSTRSARYVPTPPDQPRHQGSNGHQMAPSEREAPEYPANFGRHSEPELVSHGSQVDSRALTYRGEPDDISNDFTVPPVPPSLVPGIDPSLARQVSDRINQDRKQVNQTRQYAQQAIIETPPRGRSMDYRYDQDGSQAAYNAAPPSHNRSPVTYTNGPSTSSVNVVIKSRAFSPNPPIRDASPTPHHQHTIRRKSVSPQPPPPDTRRLSGVPFGPDSYDALNPCVSSTGAKDAATSRPEYDEMNGKIITHDGREIDPSDHLPMESWAPEPDAKNAKQGQSVSPSSRPSLSGPQPQPPVTSGRRPLRIAGRPQSMLPSSSVAGGGYIATDHVEQATPSPPAPPTGRNRLQKKAAYRTSTTALPALPAPSPVVPMMSGANGPGPSSSAFRRTSGSGTGHGTGIEPKPLAPLPPHQDNFTPPRQITRSATFDSYSGGNENYAPAPSMDVYGRSPGSLRGGPPIPAKVPLALPPPPSHNSGGVGTVSATSGALQLHSSSLVRRSGMGMMDDGYDGYGHHGGGGGGGGGGGLSSLEEELRQIDIGTGRSSRRHHAAAVAHGNGYGGHGGYGYAHAGGY